MLRPWYGSPIRNNDSKKLFLIQSKRNSGTFMCTAGCAGRDTRGYTRSTRTQQGGPELDECRSGRQQMGEGFTACTAGGTRQNKLGKSITRSKTGVLAHHCTLSQEVGICKPGPATSSCIINVRIVVKQNKFLNSFDFRDHISVIRILSILNR